MVVGLKYNKVVYISLEKPYNKKNINNIIKE